MLAAADCKISATRALLASKEITKEERFEALALVRKYLINFNNCCFQRPLEPQKMSLQSF